MELKKSLAALAIVSIVLTEAQLGVLPMFSPVVEVTQAATETFTFPSSGAIRDFVNGLGAPLTPVAIVVNGDDAGALDNFDPVGNNDSTRQKICELKGYPQVVGSTTDYYRSCYNNVLAYWNGSAFVWEHHNACIRGNDKIETLTCSRVVPQCRDGIDNDGDGAIDSQDFSCQGNPDGTDEGNPKAQCQDGIDNDGDGYTDFPQDPGCTSKQDNDESPKNFVQCNDGVDNDGDGAIDSQDFSCSGPTDNDETNPKAQCQDGIDNDGDGYTDFPQDPGCSSKQDNDEGPKDIKQPVGYLDAALSNCTVIQGWTCDADNFNQALQVHLYNGAGAGQQFLGQVTANIGREPQVGAQCGGNSAHGFSFTVPQSLKDSVTHPIYAYGINIGPQADNALLTGSPFQLTCATITQCNDGVDNDGDGAIDSQDFSCSGPTDNDETNPKAQCQDGVDNDGDTLVDFPQDPGCTSKQDNDENSEPAPTVDLKLNGQDGPVTLQAGTVATLTWTSAGTARCSTDGSNMPGWGTNEILPVSGSRQITVSQSGMFRITCSKTLTSPFVANDSVTLTSQALNQCQDGIDNDGDGAIDSQDFSCSGPTDNDETNPKAQCQDGVDNDGDTLVDFPQDPGCTSTQDNDEFNAPTTADLSITKTVNTPSVGHNANVTFTVTVHNNGPAAATEVNVHDNIPNGLSYVSAAGATCYLALPAGGSFNGFVSCPVGPLASGATRSFQLTFKTDAQQPNCTQTAIINTATVSENDAGITDPNAGNNSGSATINVTCAAVTQCQDGIDNDGDGAIDLSDFSCQNDPNHTDEGNPKSQCQDGIDNDNDSFVDYPNDPGCTSKQDNDESPVNVVQCNDGIDNDSDGLVDYPQDPGCTGPTDTTENSEPNPTVDLKINGVDGPVSLVNGSTATLTWNSTGTARCSTDGSNMPGWGANEILPIFGSRQVTISQSGIFHITCAKTLTAPFTANDSVSVTLQTLTQCQDGIDNDGDGAVDLQDFSCQNNPTKNDETAPQAQCQDGVDNDGDLLVDFPQDPGCTSLQDNDESPNNAPSFTGNKTADVQTVLPGGIITYTLSFTNIGQASQQNVRIIDTAPNGTLFVAQGSTQGCVSADSINVTCAPQTVAPGQTITATLKFQVLSSSTCGGQNRIDNIGSLQVGGNTYQTTNHVQTSITCPAPQFTAVKTASPTVLRGGTIPYAITVTNVGQASQSDITLTDILPSGVTLDSSATAGCYVQAGTVTCQARSFTSGQSFTYSLPMIVSANAVCGSTITNTAIVRQGTQSIVTSNPTNTVVDCPVTNADLSLTKTGPASVLRGGNLTYTLAVSNAGPTTATNVVLHDPVPAGLTFTSASNQQCALVGSEVTCPLSSVAAGDTALVTLAFATAAAGQTCTAGSVTNTANVTASTTDPTPNNASSTAVVALTCPQPNTADLSIVKTPLVSSVIAGDTITYSVTVTNNGPASASQIVVNDTVPTNLTYVSVSGTTCALALPGGGGNAFLSCDVGTLASGGSKVFQLTFKTLDATQQCTQTSVTNTATVVSTDQTVTDPSTANNTSTATAVTVQCPTAQKANLGILKFGQPSIVRGTNAIYNLLATNYGPAAATNVVVTDVIPTGMSFVSASGAQCSQVNNEVRCNVGTLPSGQSSQFISITFAVPTVQNCTQTSVTNIGRVSSDVSDDVTTNNESQVVSTLTCPQTSSDVSVQMTGPTTAQYGSTLTYTVTATNNGPASASGVIIRNPVPTGLTFVTATGATCSLQGNEVVCTVGTLAAGQSTGTISLVFSTPAQLASAFNIFDLFVPRAFAAACVNGSITNTVIVTSGSTDPNSGNNQSSVTTQLTCAQKVADLSVVKTGSSSVINGQQITYTLMVTNNGPSSVSGATVTDTFPISNLTYLSATGASCTVALPGGGTSGFVTCDPGTLASGATKQIKLTFQAPAQQTCSQATIINSASIIPLIGSNVTDPNAGNNQSIVQTSILCNTADLSIQKTGPSSVVRGSTMSYTLTVFNAGPASVSNVKVVDPFNTSTLTYTSATGATCTNTASQVECAVGTMAAGQTVTITLNFTVQTATSCTQSSITNIATVSETDPNVTETSTANNTSSTVTTTVTCQSGSVNDISIAKTDTRSTVNVNENLRYSITLTNTSSSDVLNLQVTDPVPSDLTILSVSDSGQISGQSITWNNISVGANQSRTLYVDVRVGSNVTNNATLTNTATVSGASGTSKSATDTTLVQNTVTYNPPTYYPPYTPPTYYPPYTPPTYQPPVYQNPPIYQQPPVTYPQPIVYQDNTKPYVLPITGSHDGDLYSNPTDTSTLAPATQQPVQDSGTSAAIFYATFLAMLAAGSAAASKFFTGGLFL